MQSNEYIQFFDGGIEPKLENLGGKGASLVTMTEADMPVPPGFVVTTAQFDAFMEEAGITLHIHQLLADLDPEDMGQVDKVSAAIREDICSRAVPEEMRELTVGAYEALMSRFEAPVPVAVRSSATAEDLPDASFAGQQDTYLWLDGVKAVTEHIRQCWASLFTSRAIIYRLKNNIPNEGLSMAVVVQKMVNARVSGVAITMDPTNGDRSKITIDSSYGVGEMVVSGQVTPDNIMLDKVSAAIREDICSRAVPQALRGLTVGAYEALMSRFDAPVPVAVRSSATAEDLPDASFAGQQDTYLWLDGVKAVTEHIRQCWASLFTSRAIIYRLKNNIPNEGLSMAVVVQKMVNARVSGVAITMDPTNGDRSKITIDSSYGVGEMVVSGQVTPDNIMLDKVTLTVISEHLGDKHAELVPVAGVRGLVEREVDAERRGRRSLTDAELTAVAQMAKRAEKHYKCPQDIEWALDTDLPDGDNLLLLQSRPETVHSSRPAVVTQTAPSSAAAGGYFSGLSPAPAAPAPGSPTTAAGPAPSSASGFSLGSITASLLKPSV